MKFADVKTHPLAIAYLLVIGVCIFVWPVVLGIPSFSMRLIWVVLALALLFFSTWQLHRALEEVEPTFLRFRDVPWWIVIIACAAIAPTVFMVPPHAFSDEATIAIPSLSLLGHLATATGWPLMAAGVIADIVLLVYLSKKLRLSYAMLIVGVMALGAIGLAWMVPGTTNLATRFPPVVHLLQSMFMGIGQGNLMMLRAVNIFWTALLAIAIWRCTPHWGVATRLAAFAGLLLGPMGWIYHVSLYQACGEITLGMLAVLLVAGIVDNHERHDWVAYAAITFSVWMLYRPTAIIGLCVAVVLLWFMNRREAAYSIINISFPVACIWLALYPTYHYSFILNPAKGALFPAIDMGQPLLPLLTTIQALPGQFHPLVIGLLVISSIVVFMRGSHAWRMALGIAWAIGLSTTAVQQLIQLPVYWGYPRFSILLLLPLAIGIAGVCSLPELSRRWHLTTAGVIVAMLVVITPFDTVEFAHRLRVYPTNIYQTTTGGDAALPVALITEKMIREHPYAVFVIPDGTYMDLYVAKGLLTVPERSRLLQRGKEWTPESGQRPVIVQAPTVTTYGPNVPAEQEQRLKAARAWALEQPGHEVIKYGLEEVVIVYE